MRNDETPMDKGKVMGPYSLVEGKFGGKAVKLNVGE